MDTTKWTFSIGIFLALASFIPWFLEKRGIVDMPPSLILWSRVVGIILLASTLYYAFYPNLVAAIIVAFVTGIAVTWWWMYQPAVMSQPSTQFDRKHWESYAKITVYGEYFRNEIVVLDGKSFQKCTFNGVTFQYDGVAPFQIIDSEIYTPYTVYTKNMALHTFFGFLKAFRYIKDEVQIYETPSHLR